MELVVGCGQLAAAGFSQPDARTLPDIYVWADTCNVHVLRDGEAGLLINLGDGSVLEHPGEIGVMKVGWISFTDHHWEQTQGASKLGPWRERGTQIAAARDAKPGVQLIAFDITRDGVRQGDLFDAIFEIKLASP